MEQTLRENFGLFSVLLLIAVGFLVYFAPIIIAIRWGRSNSTAIFMLNFFLGWTLIGWIVALVWAVSDDMPPVQQQIPAPVISPDGKSYWDGSQWKPMP